MIFAEFCCAGAWVEAETAKGDVRCEAGQDLGLKRKKNIFKAAATRLVDENRLNPSAKTREPK